MNNLSFFRSCMANELAATVDLLRACPVSQLAYRPHPVNRSAKEIIEHILAHLIDLNVIAEKSICEETMSVSFANPEEAASKLEKQWEAVLTKLEKLTSDQWEKETVELIIEGNSFVTLPRTNMMWFFFFDIIHHRGQLSTYIRPMGGKNPAVYGYSADNLPAFLNT